MAGPDRAFRFAPLVLLLFLLSASPLTGENTDTGHYMMAVQKMQEFRFEEAVTNLRQAIRLSRDNPAYLYSELSECFYQLGRMDAAVSNMKKAIGSSPENAEYYLKLADLYSVTYDAERVKETYRDLLAIEPENTLALFNLASILDMEDDRAGAEEFYIRLISADPEQYQAAFNLINMYIQVEDYATAIAHYTNLPAPLREDLFLSLEYLYCLKKTGSYEKAYQLSLELEKRDMEGPGMLLHEQVEILYFLDREDEVVKKVRELDRYTGRPLLFDALVKQIRSEDLQTALVQVNQSIAIDRLNLLAHYAKAKILVLLGEDGKAYDQMLLCGKICYAEQNYSMAEKSFRYAGEMDREAHQPPVLLSVLYFDMGRPEDALDSIDRAIALSPTTATLYRYKGEIQEKSGDLTNAYRTYNRALELEPDDFETLLKAGYIAAMTHRTGESLELFKRAMELHPDDPSIQTLIGLNYFNNSQFSNALNAFTKVKRLDPRAPRLHYYMAICYDKVDQLEQAITNLRIALEQEPENPDVYNYLGYLLADNDMHLEEALSLTRKAVKLSPDNPFFLDSLGWALFKLERYRQSIEALAEAARLFEERDIAEPVVYDHLGDAYFMTGDRGRALENWQRAYEMDRSSQVIKRKIERLNSE